MKEEEIRKRKIFNKYLRLVEKDAKKISTSGRLTKIDCPGCGGKKHVFEFKKFGFKHFTCRRCRTLFVNPRPPFPTLKEFYSYSETTSFFANEFFKPVAEVRRKNIFKPRAKYIKGILGKNKGLVIGDIGAGFGIFLEELRKILPQNRYIAIEPHSEMAEICRNKKLEVKSSCLEDIKGMNKTFDLLVAFELVEHLFDPAKFFKKVHSLLKPGGHFFLTTLNGKGFDILILWKEHKNIAPPEHLNFFNPKSIGTLMKISGFTVREILTPGRLDWDIVEGMIRHEGVKPGRFWERLSEDASPGVKRKLQNWVSDNMLSSHMSVLARKNKK